MRTSDLHNWMVQVEEAVGANLTWQARVEDGESSIFALIRNKRIWVELSLPVLCGWITSDLHDRKQYVWFGNAADLAAAIRDQVKGGA